MIMFSWNVRRHRYTLGTALLFFFISSVLFIRRMREEEDDAHGIRLEAKTLPESDPPGHHDWTTQTSFSLPSADDAASKPLDQLCESFPSHLLDDIQPILKTGAGVFERLESHLVGDSVCLSNLIIVADVEGSVDGRRVVDVIQEIPSHLRKDRQLNPWRKLYEDVTKKSASEFVPKLKDGWKTDKFKFLASVSHAWHERPMRSWYVFLEGDTYIFWDGVFRMLANLDPDEPLYLGSPTRGRGGTFFANGGPGFILSRAAMQKLVSDDYHHETGEYLGSILSEKEWDNVLDDCCGDSILGWALAKRGVLLSGLYPMFTPHSAPSAPFTDKLWCQPLIGMHKTVDSKVVWGLARWEWQQRQAERPLLYRDLALSYHLLNKIVRREDWSYSEEESFSAPPPGDRYSYDPHASVANCAKACDTHDQCFQWHYHMKHCSFTRLFRMGFAQAPGFGDKPESWWRKVLRILRLVDDPFRTAPQTLRFITGWNTRLIQKFADEHPCDYAQWIKPSVKRIS